MKLERHTRNHAMLLGTKNSQSGLHLKPTNRAAHQTVNDVYSYHKEIGKFIQNLNFTYSFNHSVFQMIKLWLVCGNG